MDSPVIVDAASKFGREIDLDHRWSFPGFPFDDDADVFERPRSDGIRAHLDDLAARHPELAEHLRGPPWPFGSSVLRDRRRRRRGSGGSSNDGQQQQEQQQQQQQQQGQQYQVDEDARSQASGSSAASGASAVSSHSGGGVPDLTSSSAALPQYGLRNTVDIGQQQRRRDMEISPEKVERGHRSMSAPPENRQQQQQDQSYQQQQQQQPSPPFGQGQRFVSRVDITPQHNAQQQQRAQSPGKPASNIRHIPIFVEGRDEPVVSKVAPDDGSPSASSTFHHQRQSSPPHFHRPSHFNEHFARQQWPPSHFQNAFYEPGGFEQPVRRQQFQQYHQQPQSQQPQSHQQSQYHQQQQQQPPEYEQHQQPPQQQSQQTQQQQQQQQQQETPKPKPPLPRDALEKVALVQKEVDHLAEEVQQYAGGSRQDKGYMYLDEMLTRELIKLDDIETEGRENVRQARKNAIKSIQDTIGLLETKAPLAGQQLAVRNSRERSQESIDERSEQGEKKTSQSVLEPMDVDVKQEKQPNEPIPLPPAPSSPTKAKIESSENGNVTAADSAAENVLPAIQRNTDVGQNTKNHATGSIAVQSIAPTTTSEPTKEPEEATQESKPNDGQDEEQRKNGENVTRTMMDCKDAIVKQTEEELKDGKVDGGGQRSLPRTQKRTKKKKEPQQQPVSEQAIPLPPPPATESAK